MTTRSPLEGKLVTLIGGSGFLGSHIAQDLLQRGARVRIASREPEKAFKLKPLANLGQLQLARCNAADADSIRKCVAGSDAVAYLIGTFEGNQRQLQAKSAGVAAEAAAAGGATSFVYISAIGADPEKETGYYRTKGEGEKLVLDAFPTATVIRPSVIFGEESGLIPMFADMVRMMPAMPVFGAESKFQVVWVDDVAAAATAALEKPGEFGGKRFDAAGPEALSMMQIHRMIAEAQNRERAFFEMPGPLARIFASIPFSPINKDQYAMLEQGSTPSGDDPLITEMGIDPKPLSLFLDRWMTRYRKHGRFGDKRAA